MLQDYGSCIFSLSWEFNVYNSFNFSLFDFSKNLEIVENNRKFSAAANPYDHFTSFFFTIFLKQRPKTWTFIHMSSSALIAIVTTFYIFFHTIQWTWITLPGYPFLCNLSFLSSLVHYRLLNYAPIHLASSGKNQYPVEIFPPHASIFPLRVVHQHTHRDPRHRHFRCRRIALGAVAAASVLLSCVLLAGVCPPAAG